MALSTRPGTDALFADVFAEALREEALASAKFFRAMHYRESPWPTLRGPRLAVWLARRLRVWPDIRWTRDPDWEPVPITWKEDSTVH